MKEVDERKTELEAKGFKVEVVHEQPTPMLKYITMFRSSMQSSYSNLTQAAESAEDKATSHATIAEDHLNETVNRLTTLARQHPEALVVGTATAAIVPSIFARSFTIAARNLIIGTAFVGGVLCPQEFSSMTRAYFNKLMDNFRTK